jgi:hypothetical protein
MVESRARLLVLLLAFVPAAGCLEASADLPDGMPEPFQGAPPATFLRDDREPEVVVQSIGAGFEWNTLGIRADVAGTRVTVGDADDEPAPMDVPTRQARSPSSSAENILAGDFLRFCSTEGSTPAVTYWFVDLETNTIVYEVDFVDLPVCA